MIPWKVHVIFEATEFTGALPPDSHKIEVPDGWGTWAIVSRPGEGFFYLLHKGTVRKIDYSKLREVTDTPANDLPAEFRDEVTCRQTRSRDGVVAAAWR